MTPDDLELALATLWTKSQVPFDRPNLSAYTGLDGKQLERGLTALIKAGRLGVKADGGEISWTMVAGARPIEGPETLERFSRLEKMRAEVKAQVRARALAKKTGKPLEDIGGTSLAVRDRKTSLSKTTPDADDSDDDDDGPGLLRAAGKATKSALGLVSNAAGKLDRKATGGRKSLLASGALSFMGPLGWLYAGSFREAVPTAAVFTLLAWLIPNPILWPLLWFILPVSSIAGVLYAWQYNRAGERRSLFLGSGDDE